MVGAPLPLHDRTAKGMMSKDVNNIVSNFVESVRIEQTTHNQEPKPSMSDRRGEGDRVTQPTPRSEVEIPGLTEAKRKSASALLETEKFRASITEPQGLCQNNQLFVPNIQSAQVNIREQCEPAGNLFYGVGFDFSQIDLNNGQGLNKAVRKSVDPIQGNATGLPNIGQGVSDDDFFHLTCFIEPSLIHRIEKGEFIELEKLLPKDKSSGASSSQSDGRLEWVQRDGGTYLVPANGKDTKITGIRKWEQAFCAYATIYCGANPHRAKEIWQYISVINTAAAAYSWDNVYNYDITFRHLMAFNPNRSWAVTYNQMWNLSMRDPLPKGNYQ